MSDVGTALAELALKQSAAGMRRMGATEAEVQKVVEEARLAGNDKPFVAWMRKRMGR